MSTLLGGANPEDAILGKLEETQAVVESVNEQFKDAVGHIVRSLSTLVYTER